MRKLILLSLAFLFIFTTHASISAEESNSEGTNYEENIDTFLNNPDQAFKISELVNDPGLAQAIIESFGFNSVDTEITWNELNDVTEPTYSPLHATNKNISDTSGLRIFTNTNLNTIRLSKNKITTFKIPKTANLVQLDLGNNLLEELDLTNGEEIQTLYIEENNLSQLDLTNANKLRNLRIYGNNLSKIDLTAVKDTLKNLHTPSLNFVGTELSELNITQLQMKQTEVALNDLGLEELPLESLSFYDVEFLDGDRIVFPAIDTLTRLAIDNSSADRQLGVKNLDISNLASLTSLRFKGSEEVSTIDLSNNINLEQLYLTEVNLKSLDLSKLKNMYIFGLENTSKIDKLDLSNNEKLDTLYFSFTDIGELNLPSTDNFKEILILGGDLPHLDLSGLTNIEEINVFSGGVRTLTANDLNIKKLFVQGNELTSLSFVEGLNLDNLEALNISSNVIDLETEDNLRYHNMLLEKLGEWNSVSGEAVGYSATNQRLSYVETKGQRTSVRNNEAFEIGNSHATVTFPKDLPYGSTFVAEELDDKTKTDLTNGSNFEVAGDIYEFNLEVANDEAFEGKFTLVFNYDKESFTSDEVAIHYYNKDSGEWEPIKSDINENEGTVTALVDHFSTYGVLAQTSGERTEESNNNDTSQETDEEPTDNEIESNDEPEEDVSNQEDVANEEQKQSEQETLPNTSNNYLGLSSMALLFIFAGGTILFINRRHAKN